MRGEEVFVGVVAIAIGCHLHAGAVIAALEAGKHVLVEVPAVATTIDDVWRMVHAAERGRLKLQMGNHERWTPQKRKMKEMIVAGEIGEIMWADGDYTHDGFRRTGRGPRNYMSFDLSTNRPEDDPPHWRLGYGNAAQETTAGGRGIAFRPLFLSGSEPRPLWGRPARSGRTKASRPFRRGRPERIMGWPRRRAPGRFACRRTAAAAREHDEIDPAILRSI